MAFRFSLQLTILPALVLTATAASGQTTYRFGVQAGFNRATTTQEVPTTTTYGDYTGTQKKSALLAGQVGVVVAAERGHWGLQTGLLFSQKGTIIKGSSVVPAPTQPEYELRREGQTEARYNWLELPLNVVYRPGNSGLLLLAGPYVALGVGGKATTNIRNSTTDPTLSVTPTSHYTDKIEYGPSANSGFPSRRFDAGFNAGVGYRFGPVQVQASYGFGLVDLYRNKVADRPTFQSGYNRVAQLTGAYFFGK